MTSTTDAENAMTEKDLEFFRPMWRRVVTTLICAFWTLLEVMNDAPGWSLFAAGVTIYCAWRFFYNFPERKE